MLTAENATLRASQMLPVWRRPPGGSGVFGKPSAPSWCCCWWCPEWRPLAEEELDGASRGARLVEESIAFSPTGGPALARSGSKLGIGGGRWTVWSLDN